MSEENTTTHEADIVGAERDAGARGTMSIARPPLYAVVGLTAAVSVPSVIAYRTLEHVQALDHRLADSRDRIEKMEATVAATDEKMAGLENEVHQLRRYVASDTSHDLIFLKIIVLRPGIDQELAREIAQYVQHYCSLHNEDPDLVLALIDVESNFDPKAVSHAGAIGLMQVMPQWRRILGIAESLDDPETSIKYGLQILGFYREMYKDLHVALTAYNRGPGAVDSALMRGKDPNNGYAPVVIERYEELKGLTLASLD